MFFIETPLCIATSLQKPRNVIIALFSGGAHLDFRAKDDQTPMHRAAARGNYEAIKVRSSAESFLNNSEYLLQYPDILSYDYG